MLSRILRQSLLREKRRRALAIFAVMLGTTALTAVATLELAVQDKVSRELRSFGANIAVTPAADGLPLSVGGIDYRPVASGSYLPEADLIKLKKIFWRHNIIAFAPLLYAPARIRGTSTVLMGAWFDRELEVDPGSVFTTGLRSLHPNWSVEGKWPEDDKESRECLVGRRLAQKLGVKVGETLEVAPREHTDLLLTLTVAGILETGGAEDDQVVAPLRAVQRWAGLEGKVRRVEVSALTKPEDDFARVDVSTLAPAEFDRWYCTPYVSSIAYQIQEVLLGTRARPVFQVAETEGKILGQVSSLLWTLALAALVTAILAVGSTALATILERRPEIGLMKAMGAGEAHVARLFLLEATVTGLLGGVLGYFSGSLLAGVLAEKIFGTPASFEWIIFPAMLTVALAINLAGHAWPLLWARRFSPTEILHDQQAA